MLTYLQMDMANLSNQQQSITKFIIGTKRITDNAARNAALQFNATSQNQLINSMILNTNMKLKCTKSRCNCTI